MRRTISYEGFNNERWLLSVDFDNNVTVTCNGETRIYEIPKKILKIENNSDYVFVYVEGKEMYQFKFEINNFLVGDIFTIEGEHIDSFASHVFGEN